MGYWTITSKREPQYMVRLGDCDQTHAQSVYDQLVVEPTFPSDLTLTSVAGPDTTKPAKRGLFARIFGRS